MLINVHSIGKYMLWLLGITENITQEMEEIFIKNYHSLLKNIKVI